MRTRFMIFACFVFLAMPLVAAVTQVHTESGTVAGVPGAEHPAVTAFKGIPYAAPPIGDLRWRDPKPLAPWQGVRNADKLGHGCMQSPAANTPPLTDEYNPQNDFSEDCLYLNVWTAAAKAGEKRPVLVWLHGGGSSEGSSASAVYDGEGLASKGLVVMSVNFRIAQLGFFTHPDLAKESDRNTPGNYGFMDILTALRWVQKNIAAFGGDPSRVTIGGQGWGVACVQALTASPMFKGLFHRVILEGNAGFGAGNSGGARKMEDAERDGLQYARDRGGKSLAELRAMSMADLRKSTGTGILRFGPVVDGSILFEAPQKTVNEGKQIDVATLTGMDLDAGGGPNAGKTSLEEWRKQVQERYSEMAADFLKLYPSDNAEQVLAAQKASARDQSLVSINVWAKTKTKLGKAPVFTYYFTHAQPGEFKEKFGAFARSEEPYFFNNLGKISRPWDATDRKLADTMSSYLVNFVATGDPNGKGLPAWPAFDSKTSQMMEIGDRIAPRAFADKAIIDFFERYLSRPTGR
jgi:para-nitrobenzyl esterase